MHYDVQQRERKKHAAKIKLLSDAGSLFVFQHHANNDFINNCMILYCDEIKQNYIAETCLIHELCHFNRLLNVEIGIE